MSVQRQPLRCLGVSALVGLAVLAGRPAEARDESGMYETVRPHPRAARVQPASLPVSRATRATRSYVELLVHEEEPEEMPGIGEPSRPLIPHLPREEAVSVPEGQEWLAAILADDTLENGDVVMFPEGPKVFTRTSGYAPWSAADFADVAQADGLSANTRRHLLALLGRSTRQGAGEMPDAGKIRVTITQGLGSH
jgi:hypothetical protein